MQQQQQLQSVMGRIRQDLQQASQIVNQLQQNERSNQQMAQQAQFQPQNISSAQMGSFAQREANAVQKLQQVSQLINEISQQLQHVEIQAQTQMFQQPQPVQGAYQPYNPVPANQPQAAPQGGIYQSLKQATQQGQPIQQAPQPQQIQQPQQRNPVGFQPVTGSQHQGIYQQLRNQVL